MWREVLGLLDDAADEGLPIVAQVAGRSIGILYCPQGSVHPLLFHPAYAEVAHLPTDERLVALADPERRRRFLLEVTRAISAAIGPDKILSIKLNPADFQPGGFTEDE